MLSSNLTGEVQSCRSRSPVGKLVDVVQLSVGCNRALDLLVAVLVLPQSSPRIPPQGSPQIPHQLRFRLTDHLFKRLAVVADVVELRIQHPSRHWIPILVPLVVGQRLSLGRMHTRFQCTDCT